jgi:hypothetical protein
MHAIMDHVRHELLQERNPAAARVARREDGVRASRYGTQRDRQTKRTLAGDTFSRSSSAQTASGNAA